MEFQRGNNQTTFTCPETYQDIFFIEVESFRLSPADRVAGLIHWAMRHTLTVNGSSDVELLLNVIIEDEGFLGEYIQAIHQASQIDPETLRGIETMWRRQLGLKDDLKPPRSCKCAFCRNPDTQERPEYGFTREAKCVFGKTSLVSMRLANSYSLLVQYPGIMNQPPWFAQLCELKQRVMALAEMAKEDASEYREAIGGFALPTR